MSKLKIFPSLVAASALLIFTGIPAAYAVSTFGQEWTESSLAPGDMVQPFLESVAFGNGTFVAVSDDDVPNAFWSSAFSVDKWYEAKGADSVTPGGVDVAFGAGKFVSINYSDVPDIPLNSSDNGRTWSQGTGALSESYRTVAFGNGTFVALSGNGTALISTDGVEWLEVTGEEVSGLTGFDVEDLIFSGTNFVAVGQQEDEVGNLDPAILISSTGTTWTRTFTQVNASGNQQPVKAVGGDGAGNLMALQRTTSGTTALRSTDHGATWNKAGSFTEHRPLSAGYANGAWFAGGSDYGLMRSTDFGETWEDDTNFPDDSSSEGEQTAYSFAFGDGILVSAGYGYSPDEAEFSPIWFTGTYSPSGGGGDNGGQGQLANTGSNMALIGAGAIGLFVAGAIAVSVTMRARRR